MALLNVASQGQTAASYPAGIGAIGGSNGVTLNLNELYGNSNLVQCSMNFGLLKAHGGLIVVCRRNDHTTPEYYIIPEGAEDFDRELGKIITMHYLKTST